MQFGEVRKEIETFWINHHILFKGGGDDEVNRIQRQYARPFPDLLKEYIGEVLPPGRFHFEAYGTYKTLYGFRELSSRKDGYSWNSLIQLPINEWRSDWLLIGDEEVDPLIIDLRVSNVPQDQCPVFEAEHGTGEWRFRQVSSSLPQFLLCAAYVDHALTRISTSRKPIVREKKWFRPNKMTLVDEVADWVLPRIRQCDPKFYDYWVGVFGK